jgi:hypothetical protein
MMTRPLIRGRFRALRTTGLVAAGLCALTGLSLIWIARASVDRFLYVSELGAEGEPTAGMFRCALLLIAAGAGLLALCAPDLSPRARWLAVVSPAAVLAGSAVAFAIASQVTCTRYCPLPVGPTFTWQDFIHTLCAVLGFIGAAFVMLQVAWDRRYRALGRFSLIAALAVAAIAATGGILSLLQLATQLGGVLEFVATSVALLWMVGAAWFLAAAVWRTDVGSAAVPAGLPVALPVPHAEAVPISAPSLRPGAPV